MNKEVPGSSLQFRMDDQMNARAKPTGWSPRTPSIHPALVQFRMDDRLFRLYRLQSALVSVAFQFSLQSPRIARKIASDLKMEIAGRINFEFW